MFLKSKRMYKGSRNSEGDNIKGFNGWDNCIIIPDEKNEKNETDYCDIEMCENKREKIHISQSSSEISQKSNIKIVKRENLDIPENNDNNEISSIQEVVSNQGNQNLDAIINRSISEMDLNIHESDSETDTDGNIESSNIQTNQQQIENNSFQESEGNCSVGNFTANTQDIDESENRSESEDEDEL